MNGRTVGAAIVIVVIAGVAGAGGYLAAGGSTSPGSTTTAPTTLADPPEEVTAVQPLAETFFREIREHYPEARVFVTTGGHVAMEYDSGAGSGNRLTAEMQTIALEYSRVVNETGENATSLSIVTGSVEAIVPGPGVRAHANGTLADEAFGETIEVRTVERTA